MLAFESERQFRALRSALVLGGHLDGREQGAFLFASPEEEGTLRVVEIAVIRTQDFTVQTAHCLQLQEDVLQNMILRAHGTSTALVEAHSHPFTSGSRVCLSPTDREGLAQAGPHVAWRLPERPYIALVFGWDAFDSLYWEGRDRPPRGCVDLLVGGQLLRASRESKRSWRESHGQI